MTRGFIALMSVILIAGFLLVVVTTLSMRSFYARLGVLERENKEVGRALAHACIESLRLRLLAEPLYAGGDYIPLKEGVCRIEAFTDSRTITTYEYHRTVTTLAVDIDEVARTVVQVREIPSQ